MVVSCFGSTTFGLKHFRLKHGRSTGDSQRGGSLVCAGGAVVTRVSEPPRGCRRETDLNLQIGLRMLTRYTHGQSHTHIDANVCMLYLAGVANVYATVSANFNAGVSTRAVC